MRPALIVGMASIAALAVAGCNKKEDAQKPAEPQAAGAASPAATAPASASASITQPMRKPGLWTQTITISDGGLTQTSKLCLDEDSSAKLSMFGQQMSKDACEKNDLARGADGSITFSSVCDIGTGGKTTTTGTMTGDFASKYHVVAKTSTTGAEAPQMNGSRTLNIDAEWTGPCPTGFKPGDMEIAKGVKVNVLAMSAKGAAAKSGR
ncbi:MAG: DUF3617 family protein [Caulobacteraceae bacterium]|nr:DUF3617 family protein [Caulobacteraceae bacterium]